MAVASTIDVVMPQMGSSVTEGTISRWLKQVGDAVQADETIVATVSDDTALRPGQSGIEVTHRLARHGAHASFMAVPAARRGVLESLMECARERSADLLVLGIVRHTPLHDLVFGGATADLFQGTARLPCLVAS